MTTVKGWGGRVWLCRCYCQSSGHCGTHHWQWKHFDCGRHTILRSSCRSSPWWCPPAWCRHFTLRISTIIMESGHTIVADTEVGLHQSLRCWLLFCQLINYDPLGWYQNNQNITRFSPNPLVGLRNCFPSFSFQNVFTDAWTQIFQLFHTNIFSQRFSAFDSMTEAQRSFAASLSPVIFNLQPSADEIQNKIRSPGRTSQLYNLNYHIARLEH